jgi:hypothetical protein
MASGNGAKQPSLAAGCLSQTGERCLALTKSDADELRKNKIRGAGLFGTFCTEGRHLWSLKLILFAAVFCGDFPNHDFRRALGRNAVERRARPAANVQTFAAQ